MHIPVRQQGHCPTSDQQRDILAPPNPGAFSSHPLHPPTQSHGLCSQMPASSRTYSSGGKCVNCQIIYVQILLASPIQSTQERSSYFVTINSHGGNLHHPLWAINQQHCLTKEIRKISWPAADMSNVISQ